MEDYWTLFYGTGDPLAYMMYRSARETDAADSPRPAGPPPETTD